MLHSLYEKITGAPDNQQQVKDLLVECGIAYIFDDILKNHWENGWFIPIVKYAAYTYSWETKMIRIGMDFRRAKLRIAEKVKLPIEAYDNVIDLKDPSIAMCMNRFLMLYRENFDYVDLTNKKELYQQIIQAATSFKPDEAGNVDIEAKVQAGKSADKFATDIKKLEAELLEKYRLLNPAIDEFKNMPRGNPLAYENAPYLRKKP